MTIEERLKDMHDYLMGKRFALHSLSVVFRPHDLGFFVIFNKNVWEKVTDEMKTYMKDMGFDYAYVEHGTK